MIIPLDRPGPPVQLQSGLRVKVASVTYFPPTEQGVNSPDRSEKGLRRERRKGLDEGGESLVVVDVAP